MRTVFNNSQCAHVWAQQNQPHGRGASVKFQGATFFSYHTPIARFVRDALGAPVVLVTSESYSVTTAKHMGHVRRAVRGDVQAFTVPDLFPDGDREFVSRGMSRFPSHREPDHGGNVAFYLKTYSDAKAALMRAPCESWRLADTGEEYGDGDLTHTDIPTRAHASLRECAVQFEHYSRTFALGLAAPNWQSDAAEVIARRDRLLNDPKRAEKRAKAAAARDARALAIRAELGLPATASNWQVKNAERARAWEKQRAEREERERVERANAAETIAQWRNGANVTLPYFATRDDAGGAMVRILGDKVQTSLGAEAPVAHVRRVLSFYKLAPRPWNRTGDNERSAVTLGSFTLDKIDADGNVTAGCHLITAAEVDRVRMLLGVHD